MKWHADKMINWQNIRLAKQPVEEMQADQKTKHQNEILIFSIVYFNSRRQWHFKTDWARWQYSNRCNKTKRNCSVDLIFCEWPSWPFFDLNLRQQPAHLSFWQDEFRPIVIWQDDLGTISYGRVIFGQMPYGRLWLAPSFDRMTL